MAEIVYCNRCGRKLTLFHGDTPEEACIIDKTWGYFSRKDREHHRFVLCEDCYDEFITSFQIPVKKDDIKEVL